MGVRYVLGRFTSPMVLRRTGACGKVVGKAYVANCRNIATLVEEEV